MGSSHSRFDDFYAQEFGSAVRLAHLLTGRRDLAEDLAQDSMARLYSHFESLENPIGYLRTIVVNVCRNWHRTVQREEARLALQRPTYSCEHEEFSGLLELVDSLPFRQRATLVLRYWLDLSERQIAEHLGCRLGTVKSLSTRGLERLRKELKNDVN